MYSTCRDLWRQLNQRSLKPLDDQLITEQSSLPFSAVLQSFKENTHAKTIHLPALSKEDETYLASLGISPAHLIRNLKETITGRHLDPLAFQLNAVRRKSVSGFCPFSGKRVASNRSLLANINVIFYRFETEQVFYVATAGIGSGFRKSALYFPEHELVVTAGDPWGFQQDDLVELKARMVCGAKACYDYLTGPDPSVRKVAVCLGFYHFAHHLWNELSGIHRLYRKHLLTSVDKFLVLREPLGPIEEIFPEIAVERLAKKDSTSDLFYEILNNRYFAVRVGDDYIGKDLASRISKVSSANCLPSTLAMVKDAKSKHDPLLWVGVRVGNRTWTDQVDGLSNVIASLKEEFPKLGVVFDGFSLPADMSAESSDQQGYSEVLALENAVVNGIVENLQQRQVAVGIFNIIGQSIFDATVWAHAIDVYVSPHGSLQHKVGWLTHKPGLVHTNQTFLQNPSTYIWAAVENATPPRYVDPASVVDVGSNPSERMAYNEIEDASESGAGVLAVNKRVRDNPEFNNYSVAWEMLRNDLVELIRSPKMDKSVAAKLWANRLKRKLRMTTRTITSAIYENHSW